ncbi:MAG TPA: DUF2141 domain-containing protein [Chryseosolibacter sp.]
MKTLLTHMMIVAVLLFSASMTFAQSNIEVTVKNIEEAKGSIRVGLFANENDFLKTPVEGKVVKVAGTEVKVVFENVKAGEYAVSVIHDENDNGELDTNGLGIPKEGFAFGNNAMGMFGPPSFEKAKVVVDKTPVKQVIELKYF